MLKNITNCLFCKIYQQKINNYKVYENEYVYAFLDINPIDDGHTVLIPKKHFTSFIDTNDKYLKEIIKAQKIISNNIYKKLKPLGMNYLSNENEIAGQSILHYHTHIIPKYKKNSGFDFTHSVKNTNPNNFKIIQKKIEI